ncbi:MAG TPA: Clp protease N-terminal domain-containing protein [Terriglobales bacterium]|nr:Clp protease N-terminal domain-containing protein [Terriglobales bacterium]
MFERYTEGARRVVFFARYEASLFGSPQIETEHLLLGLLREEKSLVREVMPSIDYDSAKRALSGEGFDKPKIPTSVDLPLSEQSKAALAFAMGEADRLGAKYICPEHLLLGLLHNKEFLSAKVLAQLGVNIESLRKRVEALPPRIFGRAPFQRVQIPRWVEVNGKKLNVEAVHAMVNQLREHAWLWEERAWQPRDVVYERNGKRFSFDLSLAQDESHYVLVKGGWKKDRCAICWWELFESDDAAHGTGFTNGRDWLCQECHRLFIIGDFFASAYSDIT